MSTWWRVMMCVAPLAMACSSSESGTPADSSGGTASGLGGLGGLGGRSAMGGVPSDGGARSNGGETSDGVRHGAELTRALVGPPGLGVSLTQLKRTRVDGQRIGTWPSDGMPSFIPSGAYVYNNDPSNHGGIVPSGGRVIDGFSVPAGAWVAQFYDFGDESIIITGDNDGASPPFPGIVFRGCSWRGPATAPGFLNFYAGSHTRLWLLYNDAGGLGPADEQYHEVPFSTNDSSSDAVFFRNYISYATTGIQPGMPGPQIIENFIEKITFFYGEAGPPDENGSKHLNGISLNGGQLNALILRNKVLLPTPDEAGRVVNQTDAIALFQDFGSFPGTGTNLDGSRGYQIKDNYVGGGGYSIYAGMNASKPANSVQNLALTGNQVTTEWWPKGGAFGPLAAEPQWGSYGNTKAGNTYAESGAAW